MLQKINKIYLLIHFTVIIAVSIIVLLSSWFSQTENLLRWTSQEGGIFEWASFFVTFTIAGFALLVYFHSNQMEGFSPFRRKLILFFAAISYLVAMEEISWGQHIFHFKSSAFFLSRNLQGETNLHNLVSGEYVNLVIHGFIYIFFIFLPILIYFKPDIINNSKSMTQNMTVFLPSLHNVIMFCFASSLQAFFMPKTYTDTVLVLLAYALILVLLIKQKKLRTRLHVIHYLLAIISLIIFMTQYRVFDYFNMQYEIREFVIFYSGLYWFYNWTSNLKNNIALQLN